MPLAERDRTVFLSGVVRVAEVLVFFATVLVSVGLVAAGVLAVHQSFQPTPQRSDLAAISGKVERAGRELVRHQRRERNAAPERVEEHRMTLRLTDGGTRVLAVPVATLAPDALAGLVGRDVTVRTFYGDVWTIEAEGREIAPYAQAARRHEDARPYVRAYGPPMALSGVLGFWLAFRMRRWLEERRRAALGT